MAPFHLTMHHYQHQILFQRETMTKSQRELFSLLVAAVAVRVMTMAKPNGDVMVGVVFDEKVILGH